MLREKEEANWISFLTAALSCAGDGIIATDRDGIVRYINSSGEMLTGWNEKDAVGMPFEDIFPLIDYYSGDRMNSPIKKVLKEGESSGLQNHAAMITKRESGISFQQTVRRYLISTMKLKVLWYLSETSIALKTSKRPFEPAGTRQHQPVGLRASS